MLPGLTWSAAVHSSSCKAVGDRGPGWAQVGKQSRWRERHMARCVFTPSGSVQVPCCFAWFTDAHFLSASRFQSQTWLETFQTITPGTLSFQKEDSHWLFRDVGWTLALSLFKKSILLIIYFFLRGGGRYLRDFVTTSQQWLPLLIFKVFFLSSLVTNLCLQIPVAGPSPLHYIHF